MHETGFDTSLPISAFFRAGKMDTDFVISDQYITGICVMYAQRSAQEHEYMIREKSIVMLDERGLSQCVQDAKDLAYLAAVSRLGKVNFLSAAQPHEQASVTPPPQPTTPEFKKTAPPPVTEQIPDEDDGESESGNEWDTPENEATSPPAASPPESDDDGEESLGGAQPLDLYGLQPASSLRSGADQALPPSRTAEADPAESAYEKARNMPITILGKLHECNQWTAGRILDERPEIIVDFAHRYNGPKVEERDALKMLYTEALRKVNRAA